MTLRTQHAGFTLIEMIVALGLFAVVTTITSGAVLTLISTNQRFHYEQNIMTNLSFAIDSMTREMRTGFNYHCVFGSASTTGVFGGSTNHENLGTATADCNAGRGSSNVHGVSFFESGDSLTGSVSNRILYFYDFPSEMIYRRIGNGSAVPIISEGVRIIDANFFVNGSTPLFGGGGNDDQPSILIYLVAQAADDTSASPKTFAIQTTVNQRNLDL